MVDMEFFNVGFFNILYIHFGTVGFKIFLLGYRANCFFPLDVPEVRFLK